MAKSKGTLQATWVQQQATEAASKAAYEQARANRLEGERAYQEERQRVWGTILDTLGLLAVDEAGRLLVGAQALEQALTRVAEQLLGRKQEAAPSRTKEVVGEMVAV